MKLHEQYDQQQEPEGETKKRERIEHHGDRREQHRGVHRVTDELVNASTNENRILLDIGHGVEISGAHRVESAQSKHEREYLKKKPPPLLCDETS